MSISMPDRIIDYLMYYECGANEKKTPNAWYSVSSLPPGGLISAVNWNASGNDVGDGKGVTRFGITPKAAETVLGKGAVVNTPEKWMIVVQYYWQNSHASEAANVACATQIFQGYWMGWNPNCISQTCATLRTKCDDKERANGITGNGLKAVAELTHCFNNPMDAFVYIRSCRVSYLRSCGNAKTYANGWMRREFFPFQVDGLYVEPGTAAFTKFGFTPLVEMERAAETFKSDPKSGYQKLMDWDGTISSDLSGEDLDAGYEFPVVPNYGATSTGNTSTHTNKTISDGVTMEIDPNRGTAGTVLGIHLRQKPE